MSISIYYWISGGLVLAGILLFFILSLRRKYRRVEEKAEAIEHYTKIRDEVTLRRPKKEKVSRKEKEYSFNPMSIVGALIGLGVTMFVGMQVISAVSTTLCASDVMNVSSNIQGIPPSFGTCENGQFGGGMFSMLIPIMGLMMVGYLMLTIFGMFK